jgi:ribonucleotide monophosphatase NagD (HAD superfamily)
MTYVFDIDGTICATNGSDYENSEPMAERIGVVNKLYEQGNTIFFLTARGMGRTLNKQAEAHGLLYDLTLQQLNNWGVKFHRLFLGKPAGDIYVDDRGSKDDAFFAKWSIE